MSFDPNASEKKYQCSSCHSVVASGSPDLPAACPQCGRNDWKTISNDQDRTSKKDLNGHRQDD